MVVVPDHYTSQSLFCADVLLRRTRNAKHHNGQSIKTYGDSEDEEPMCVPQSLIRHSYTILFLKIHPYCISSFRVVNRLIDRSNG
eukprot:scaffold6260_cov79-Cyclotella_meneghiniana.AAC.5